jgi:hypothetical protein
LNLATRYYLAEAVRLFLDRCLIDVATFLSIALLFASARVEKCGWQQEKGEPEKLALNFASEAVAPIGQGGMGRDAPASPENLNLG